MKVKKIAEDIVCLLIDDLKDRRGFEELFETMDEDIQEEIIESLQNIVNKELKKHNIK